MDIERKILRSLLYFSMAMSLIAFFHEGGRNPIVNGAGGIAFVICLSGLACSATRRQS